MGAGLTRSGPANPVKITFILPVATVSGGTRVVATYARLLMARGHEVTVISHRQTFTPAQRLVRTLRRQPLAGAQPRTELLDFLGPRHVIVDQDRPESLAAVPDADVVVATWWHTAEWVARMPPAKGRKFYLIQDYEIFEYTPVDRVAATYRLPLRKLAVSGYIRDTIAAKHGVTDVEVLPNGVDLDQFRAPPRQKGQPLTVGFLYTPNPRKRAGLAVEAAVAARAAIPDLRVRAFAAKPPKAEGDLPDWIDLRIAPPQDEIPGVYAACDLWLFSSGAEGFGLPVLEAMACRTPVAATRAGAAPDIVDGRNGVLVDGTPAAFAREIRRFDAMPGAEWRAWSDAAWETAQGYGWDRAVDRLLARLGADEAVA